MPRYTVDPSKRIREILGLDVDGIESEIPDTADLHYTFSQGYEELSYRKSQQDGRSTYSGVYHPNGHCEGTSLCKWCGCTLPH